MNQLLAARINLEKALYHLGRSIAWTLFWGVIYLFVLVISKLAIKATGYPNALLQGMLTVMNWVMIWRLICLILWALVSNGHNSRLNKLRQ